MILKEQVKYILNARWQFRRPRTAFFLIYDRCGSELFYNYLVGGSVAILDTRGESVNFFILVRTLISKYLKNNPLSIEEIYKNLYIKQVRPRVVLTFIDNNLAFYKLQNNKNYIKIFVQNGIRGLLSDVFYELEIAQNNAENHVDYMLVFGQAIGKKYKNYISGQTLSIGSFKNNLVLKSNNVIPRSIFFISQYRAPPETEGTFFSAGDIGVNWFDFYSSEIQLLPILAAYARFHNLDLYVCGSTAESNGDEYLFYQALLSSFTWKFLHRKSIYSSYGYVDNAEYVVFTESSLGYEALARGKRTISFSARSKNLNISSWRFGWPAELPEKGPFWTDEVSEEEVLRLMDYITQVSDENWAQVLEQYMPDLMQYDPGNKKFISLMKSLGAPLKPEVELISEFEVETNLV